MKALLVDPSLFTAPYDAALGEGLEQAGVSTLWAARPTRPGDRQEIPAEQVAPIFYGWIERSQRIPAALRPVAKGLSHVWGVAQLLRRVWRDKPDVVHYQWVVIPPLDLLAIALIRRFRPVVLTVHDTVPFNGERMSLLQNLGFDAPIRLADRAIVHTQAGRDRLLARGIAADKVLVIPHGPLRLHAAADPAYADGLRDPQKRWTFVLFGEIKPYKGADLLVEAVGRLSPAQRAGLRIVIAGRPRMDLAPLLARIAELGVEAQFDIRPRRLSEEEMAALFAAADSFLFPYRMIDASGVYFLVKSLGKWLIASRVGIFAEDLQPGVDGELVEPGDVDALAGAMARAVEGRLAARTVGAAGGWSAIGRATRAAYESAIADRLGSPVRPAVE